MKHVPGKRGSDGPGPWSRQPRRSKIRRIEGEACCTFVTGPSRTADIELTLTLGVHGPGRVVVVVGP